jgi:hypothetical protein
MAERKEGKLKKEHEKNKNKERPTRIAPVRTSRTIASANHASHGCGAQPECDRIGQTTSR